MAIELVGLVGPQTLSDGSPAQFRLGRTAEAIMTELNARYAEQTFRGNKFSLTFAAAALAVASSSAAGAFLLANPLNSGKALVLIECMPGVTAFTATVAGTSVMLGSLPNAVLTALGTPVSPNPTLVGSSNKSVALGYPSGTIAITPVPVRQLANLYLDLAVGDIASLRDEIAGAVIVAPGSAVNIYGLGGTPANITLQPTLTWDEIPWP